MTMNAIKTETGNNGKLSILAKLGYGIGTLCDSTTANLYNIFFLVFAIDFVGLNPAFAGAISAIAILWDAITDPIVGFISDKLKRSGKVSRRGLLTRAIGPLCISFFFLYRIIEADHIVQNGYYLVLALIFWTCYTVFMIPYSALGAEITNDYNERTSLRMYAHIFTLGGLIIASSLTMSIVEGILMKGGTPMEAWTRVGLIYGTIILVAGIITIVSTAKVERFDSTIATIENKNIFKTLFSTLKLKSLRIVAGSIILYAVGFTIAQGTIVFYMEKVVGLTGAGIGSYFLITALVGIVCIPLINFISNKLGKRRAYTYIILFAATLQCIFYFVGTGNFGLLLTFGIIQGVGHNAFFPLSYALVYDCCDIDAYLNKTRREGVVLSVTGLCQKGGYALGTAIAGFLLSFFSYNPELAVQTAETQNGMAVTLFVIAPILFIVCALVMSRFKINRERYNALQKALKAQAAGEEHSSNGFDELL